MDGDRKKRKAAEDEEREEEEEEERMMEEFFALVRSTRDIRERLIRRGVSSNPSERERKVWTPRFELEDFADGGSPSGSQPPPPPPPANEEAAAAGPPKEDSTEEDQGEEGKQKDGDGLDLKLSL